MKIKNEKEFKLRIEIMNGNNCKYKNNVEDNDA